MASHCYLDMIYSWTDGEGEGLNTSPQKKVKTASEAPSHRMFYRRPQDRVALDKIRPKQLQKHQKGFEAHDMLSLDPQNCPKWLSILSQSQPVVGAGARDLYASNVGLVNRRGISVGSWEISSAGGWMNSQNVFKSFLLNIFICEKFLQTETVSQQILVSWFLASLLWLHLILENAFLIWLHRGP